jgi:hypothetical protein
MENLNDMLAESLLDSGDDIIKRAEKNVYYKRFEAMNRLAEVEHVDKDMYGRELAIGDVVFVPRAGKWTVNEILLIESLETSKWGGNLIAHLSNKDAAYSYQCILIPKTKLKEFYEIIK